MKTTRYVHAGTARVCANCLKTTWHHAGRGLCGPCYKHVRQHQLEHLFPPVRRKAGGGMKVVRVHLVCDICQSASFGVDGATLMQVRRDAKRAGWTRAYNADRCKECSRGGAA